MIEKKFGKPPLQRLIEKMMKNSNLTLLDMTYYDLGHQIKTTNYKLAKNRDICLKLSEYHHISYLIFNFRPVLPVQPDLICHDLS